MIPLHRWTWRARPVRVVDGDTVDLELDRGFRARQTERIRVLGIDTPEVVGASRAAGLAAKVWVVGWMADAGDGLEWPLLIETHKPDGRDSFGRWLADVWRLVDGHSLAVDLIEAGQAVPR